MLLLHCLLVWSCVAAGLQVQASKHARHHVDAKPSHQETLIWAVTVHDRLPDGGSGSIVDLANSLDLDVLGPCHVIHQCFVLAHRNHSKHLLKSPEHVQSGNNHLHYHSKINYDITESLVPDFKSAVHRSLDMHPDVTTYSEIWVRKRFKRTLTFSDPFFERQWHLENGGFPGHDINVTGVWERNVTGRGVTVAIVDDGLEWRNPDLQDNYNSDGSYDLDGADTDPSPDYTTSRDFNAHGTRCAGEVAAVPNSVCAVGVAYGAKVSGIRVLDGPMTDGMESAAFTIRNDINDVYSCSWGPQDDGATVDGPHRLAQAALVRGTSQGRKGYGSIFVLASGNGGTAYDNCNFDGYANSIYTVTVGAVDEKYGKPYYAEDCAAMLAVTFSSGNYPLRAIATTDVHYQSRTGCTVDHSGTSAAAPIAAGMVALMLDARPCLTWRDVQYIIVMTAVRIDKDEVGWTTNAAGLKHSHSHGFGIMDAWLLVNAAKVWKIVPPMASVTIPDIDKDMPLDPQLPIHLSCDVAEDFLFRHGLLTLEYVQVTVTIAAEIRGNIVVNLTCPSGTASALATKRPRDTSSNGFFEWTFSTVRCWGEGAAGQYKLAVENTGTAEQQKKRDILRSWSLTLRGSVISPQGIRERIELVQNASSGDFLRDDVAVHCDAPPSLVLNSENYMPEIVLKILSAIGCLLLIVAIYELVEVVLLRKFCRDEQLQQGGEPKSRQPLLMCDTVAGTESGSRAAYLYQQLPAAVADANDPIDNVSVSGHSAEVVPSSGNTVADPRPVAETRETTSLLMPGD